MHQDDIEESVNTHVSVDPEVGMDGISRPPWCHRVSDDVRVFIVAVLLDLF